MAIDPSKEIQQYGPYQLVMRKKGGRVQAVLWNGAERVLDFEADDLAQAARGVPHRVSLRAAARAQERGTVAPALETVRQAFEALWGGLNHAQRAMLVALHRAPGSALGRPELAAAAGYKDASAVNMWLGNAGLSFAEMAPRSDMQTGDDGLVRFTSWFCTWDARQRVWMMRPEVFEGMMAAGCVY